MRFVKTNLTYIYYKILPMLSSLMLQQYLFFTNITRWILPVLTPLRLINPQIGANNKSTLAIRTCLPI